MAAQLTLTSGWAARGLLEWMTLASRSLPVPVPVAPSTSTVASLGATTETMSKIRRMAGSLPIMSWKV